MTTAAKTLPYQASSQSNLPACCPPGTPKEGFSVFGLMDSCATPGGHRLLRLWFARPLVNLEVLADRHDALQALMQDAHGASELRQASGRGGVCVGVTVSGGVIQGVCTSRHFICLGRAR